MIDSLLTSLALLLPMALIMGVLFLAGGIASPLYRGVVNRALTLAIRMGVGIAIALFVSAALGVTGFLHWPLCGALLALVGIAGALMDPPRLALRWPATGTLLSAPIFGLIALNMVVGGLAPDMSQDSMWYHLSVPQEWGFMGRITPLPAVMPSCYPLAVEGWYAFLIPVLGEVGCTLWYALVSILMLATAVVSARATSPGGWRLASVLFVPLLAATTVAPIPAGNDNVAALFLLLAWTALIAPSTDALPWRRWLLAGLFVGTAIAAKPVVIGLFPLLALAAFVSDSGAIRERIIAAIVLGAGAFFVYTPWLYIGLTTTGLPAFPLGAGLFGVAEEFVPALTASRSLNSLYPLSVDGIREALTVGLSRKVHIALNSGSVLTPLVLVVSVLGALAARGRERIVNLAVAAAFLPTLMMQGYSELLRYYGLLFPLGILPMAAFAALVAARLPRPRVTALTVLLLAGSLFSLARAQHRLASFRTIQWPYHPIMTEAARNDYASRTETGGLFLGFARMRDVIPPGERVFLPDVIYPYYLHRPSVWQDVIVKTPLFSEWEGTIDTAAGRALLTMSGAKWVLVTDPAGPRGNAELCEKLRGEGALIERALPPGSDAWKLYQLTGN